MNKDDYFELLLMYGTTRAGVLGFLHSSFLRNRIKEMSKKELALAVLQAKWSFEYLLNDDNFKEKGK